MLTHVVASKARIRVRSFSRYTTNPCARASSIQEGRRRPSALLVAVGRRAETVRSKCDFGGETVVIEATISKNSPPGKSLERRPQILFRAHAVLRASLASGVRSEADIGAETQPELKLDIRAFNSASVPVRWQLYFIQGGLEYVGE